MPLWKQTAAVLIEWMKRLPVSPNGPLFPNGRGGPLSRYYAEFACHGRTASTSNPGSDSA